MSWFLATFPVLSSHDFCLLCGRWLSLTSTLPTALTLHRGHSVPAGSEGFLWSWACSPSQPSWACTPIFFLMLNCGDTSSHVDWSSNNCVLSASSGFTLLTFSPDRAVSAGQRCWHQQAECGRSYTTVLCLQVPDFVFSEMLPYRVLGVYCIFTHTHLCVFLKLCFPPSALLLCSIMDPILLLNCRRESFFYYCYCYLW